MEKLKQAIKDRFGLTDSELSKERIDDTIAIAEKKLKEFSNKSVGLGDVLRTLAIDGIPNDILSKQQADAEASEANREGCWLLLDSLKRLKGMYK